MKDAFAIVPTREARPGDVDGKSMGHFPDVFCPVCRHTSTFPAVEFPTITLDEGEAKFCAERKDISPTEFTEFKRKLLDRLGVRKAILPGAGWGPFIGRVTGKLYEVSWILLSRPLFSESALRKLRQRGIHIEAGRAQLNRRGQTIDTYLTLELVPAPLFSEKTLRVLTLDYCPECRHYWKRDITAKAFGQWELVRNRWPKGAHLVRPIEHSTYIIASDEFRAAVLDLKLEGISFEKVGVWV